jgi:hypothetical protein
VNSGDCTYIESTRVGMMPSPVQLSHGYLYTAGKHGSPLNLAGNVLVIS